MYDNKYNPLSWIRGMEKGNVVIGEGTWIGPFTVIDGEYDRLEIGCGVNVSSGAQILTHDTVMRCVTNRKHPDVDHRPTKIGNYVFIGINAVILKGTIIGDHSVVSAGAVVLEETVVSPHSLVYGVPAKFKPLTPAI